MMNVEIKERSGLLVGYFVAGYPEKDQFLDILQDCDQAGIDIFEIGFPSGNPYADGITIQEAHRTVDREQCIDLGYWRQIRTATDKPIWIMAYKHDLIDTGIYLEMAKEGLVDVVVIPDCTQEERLEMNRALKSWGVEAIGFANPDMSESEWRYCFENFNTVYMQLYAGPTGMSVEAEHYHALFEYSKKYEKVKRFAGFGIKTPDKAKFLIHKGFEGVIVGTAMINNLNVSPQTLFQFIEEIKEATKAGE